MTVYLVSAVIMLFLPLVTRNKWVAITLFGMVTWFLAAFRDLNLGLYDTTGTYYELFIFARSHPFNEMASGALGVENALFAAIAKIIQLFVGNNYQAYIVILSFLFTTCFCVSIMRFASERKWSGMQIVVGCMVYFSLVYFYSYTMLRQFAALSVLIAFAYPCLKQRKLVGFILAVAFAGLLHSTALIFLIAYPLCVFIPYRKKQFIITLGLAALGTLAPHIVMIGLGSIPVPMLQARLGYIMHGVYEAETTGVGYGTLALLVALTAFCMWHRSKDADMPYAELLWLASLGIVFQGWSHIVVEFYRVAMYFIAFNAFLLPERLQFIQDRNLRAVSMLMAIGILLAYGLFTLADNTGVVPYNFCWDFGAWKY